MAKGLRTLFIDTNIFVDNHRKLLGKDYVSNFDIYMSEISIDEILFKYVITDKNPENTENPIGLDYERSIAKSIKSGGNGGVKMIRYNNELIEEVFRMHFDRHNRTHSKRLFNKGPRQCPNCSHTYHDKKSGDFPDGFILHMFKTTINNLPKYRSFHIISADRSFRHEASMLFQNENKVIVHENISEFEEAVGNELKFPQLITEN